jgi:uncharacterized protein YutE (UPF0331/DUF86 family)
MYNGDFITKAFFEIDKNLTILKKRQGVTKEQIENETELLWILAHGLQLTVQALIDIGTHILSEIGKERWEKYSEIPELLSKHNIISVTSSKSFIEMVRMRNILAHEYFFLDADKVANVINNNLDDVPKILYEYRSYLQL